MGYRVKPIPRDATLETLFMHTSGVYRQVARLFFNGFSGTTHDLAAKLDVSLSSVWMAIKAFKQAELIHIVRWVKPDNKPKSVMAVYCAGNEPDAPKPKPKDPTQVARNKKHRTLVKDKVEHEQDKYDWQGIAQALVPQRTPEQVAEINRLYLNWISEGTYG